MLPAMTTRRLQISLRMLALILASVAAASVVNAFSPRGIQWTGKATFSVQAKAAEHGLDLVSLQRMQSIVQDGRWIILDARPESQYTLAHIPGTLPVPRVEMAERLMELQMLLMADQPVVVYCGGRTCDDSLTVAKAIQQQGLKQVVVFEGGMAAWLDAGLQVQEGL